ncbi:MAG: hypothetical protein HQK89_00685 [Nitrospirae bacterium]|nr:hypothetical protein [Nitrospirota bacterium]
MARMKKTVATGDMVRKKSLKIPVTLAILAIIFDLVPNVPVAGWIEDIFVTAAALLNILDHALPDRLAWIARIVRTIKWALIVLGVMVLALGAFGIYGIIRAIKG